MEKLLIKKRNGLFNLKPIYNQMSAVSDGEYLYEGKKVRNPRSLDQNAWLWGCIYPMLLDALNHAGWEFTSELQIHEFFRDRLARQKVINKFTGEVVEFPDSTSTMDTVTFSSYCEKLREYGKEYLGIEISDPDKNWAVKGHNVNE